jgi:hypothetical protein
MQSPRWTWLTLVACAAAAASAGAQQGPAPADATQGGPVTGTGDTTESREWLVPPIGWTGSLAYDLRATRASGEGHTLSQLITGNVGARTFIYQPWFARVSGNLGLTSSWTTQSPEFSSPDSPVRVDASLHEQIRTREQFATGYGRIDVFPQSRFPFEAHVERNDSRIDSGLSSTFDFRTQNIGFSQRYRPVGGAWDLNAGYDRRQQDGLGFRATQDLVTADFNTHWKYNQLNLNGSQSHARSTGIADDSRYNTLVARHNFAPSTALSVDSTANYTRTQENSTTVANDLQVLQWSSVGLWRRENSPLQLTGTARALHLRDDLGDTTLDTWSATLGGNYDYNPNLRLTVNTGFNTTRTNTSDSNGLAASAGATYQGDSIKLAGARYDWFTGGTVGVTSTQGNRVESEQQTALNLQLGHTLTRVWNTGSLTSFTVNAGQTLSYTQLNNNLHHTTDLGISDVLTLLNTLSGTWNMGGSDRNAFARATYSDSMALQGLDNRFQLFNFQLSGNFEFDNLRSLTGDLTYQRTWQQNDTRLDGVTTLPSSRQGAMGASGEVVYRHQRLFGMPRLRFESRVRLAQDVLKQPGSLLALPDRETRLWENRLDWSVGRIDMQAILRLSYVDGRQREAFMFRIQRTFGE